jgi:hypothetical protein
VRWSFRASNRSCVVKSYVPRVVGGVMADLCEIVDVAMFSQPAWTENGV